MPHKPGSRVPPGSFPIRKQGANSYQISIPRHIGEKLYPLDINFVATLTEEGILLKPLEKLVPQGPLPSWLGGEPADG
jgi:hypothetical protein